MTELLIGRLSFDWGRIRRRLSEYLEPVSKPVLHVVTVSVTVFSKWTGSVF